MTGVTDNDGAEGVGVTDVVPSSFGVTLLRELPSR